MIDVIEGGLVLHEQIKLRLIRDVLSPATADEEFMRSDRHCEFGKWIYDPANTCHQTTAEFHTFKEAHRCFHAEAYAALCLAKAGSRTEALDSLESGPFNASAATLRAALAGLRQRLHCDGVPPAPTARPHPPAPRAVAPGLAIRASRFAPSR